MRLLSPLILLVFTAAVSDKSNAHELTTTIGAKAEYSDNILREDRRYPSDDLLSTLFLGINYEYDFTAVVATADYTARKLNYRDDSFDNRTDFVGTANVDWSIIPKRLSWNFRHIRDRVLTDKRLEDTPANEQDRTTYDTGPQLQLNLGRNSSFLMKGNIISNSTEQASSFRSHQIRGETSYVRPISSYSASLNAVTSDVNYDNSAFNYTSKRFSTSLSGAGSVVSWALNIGQNSVKRESSAKTSGLFYSASVDLERNGLTIGINSNRELTDSQIGLSLNDNIQDPLDNGDGNLDSFDIVERIRHELTASQKFQRISASYSFTRDIQDFQSLAQDENSQKTSVSISYRQSEKVSWSFRFSRQSSTFQETGNSDTRYRQYERRLTLTMKLNSKLNATGWVSTNRRSIDAGAIQGYKEEGLGLEMTFRI
ncbi:MAG: hypothetical protein ACJAYE_000151 [Candidatus Azotimanducaceae bacterium]